MNAIPLYEAYQKHVAVRSENGTDMLVAVSDFVKKFEVNEFHAVGFNLEKRSDELIGADYWSLVRARIRLDDGYHEYIDFIRDRIIDRSVEVYGNVRVFECPSKAVLPKKKKGGRRPNPVWMITAAEAFRIYVENGRPLNQVDFVEAIEGAVDALELDEPLGRETLTNFVRIIYQRCQF